MKKSLAIFIIILSVCLFSFGVYVGVYEISSFNDLNSLTNIIQKNPTSLQDHKAIEKFDFNTIIDIQSQSDIFQKRTDVVNYIWNDNELPNVLPTSIENNISDVKSYILEKVK